MTASGPDPEGSFRVHRTIHVDAPPEVVFDFFREDRLFAAWFGPGSSLDAQVGGAVRVAFPGGAEAVGEVLAVEGPHHIRFTWGYPREDSPVEPGGSVVDVRIAPQDGGSQVTLEHVLPTRGAAEAHEGGWAYHLARLAAKAARERFGARAEEVLAAWFGAWSEDGPARDDLLAQAMVEDGTYRDDAVAAPSRAEVAAHIGRCRAQMPGAHLARTGPVLQTGDRLTCRAELRGRDGPLGGVHLALRLAEDGRIAEAVGLFEQPVPGVSDGPLLGPPSEDAAGAQAAKARAPALEPHFWCADLEATRAFYEQALGFEVTASFPAEGAPTWYQLARGPVRLMLARAPADPPAQQAYLEEAARRIGSGGAVALYLRVEDAHAAHERARAAGADPVEDPWDPPWGGRQFTVADPDGHWWTCTGPAR